MKYFESQTPDNQNIYLIMEYLPGGEIIDVISNNKQNSSEAFISLQMLKLLKALKHCHNANIIHRDIKPSNIMFDGDGEVKLIDFGAAKIWNPEKSYNFVGTMYYLAPETFIGYQGAEGDVWALGVTLYQLLTGRFPFDGKN